MKGDITLFDAGSVKIYTNGQGDYDVQIRNGNSNPILNTPKPDWRPLQEVEPVRRGHWIKDYDCGASHPPIPTITCSACGWKWYNQQIGSRYCPGCGAELDGGAE